MYYLPYKKHSWQSTSGTSSKFDNKNLVQARRTFVIKLITPNYNFLADKSQGNVENVEEQQFLDADISKEILDLLGTTRQEECLGASLHRDIVARWIPILAEGLLDESKKSLVDKYPVAENFALIKAPMLNPEIRCSAGEKAVIRDDKILDNQHQLRAALSALGMSISSLVKAEFPQKYSIIEPISDAARLIAHLHFEKTKLRQTMLVPSLTKECRESMGEPRKDNWLFGENLGERVRAAKALERSAVTVKKTVPVTSARKQNGLNFRGPPLVHKRTVGKGAGPNKSRPTRTYNSHQKPYPPPPRSQYKQPERKFRR